MSDLFDFSDEGRLRAAGWVECASAGVKNGQWKSPHDGGWYSLAEAVRQLDRREKEGTGR